MKLPLLISVPHAGLRVPEEVSRFNRLIPEQIAEDGDGGAAEIYDLRQEVAAFATTEIARAYVDLNRAPDDRRPDGVVKTHTCTDAPVYESTPPETVFRTLLQRYYHPYHRRLTELAEGQVKLGFDCHTMMAIGPSIGPLAGEERPAICLSDVDGTSCPPEWTREVADALERAFDVRVAVNFPFKGGYITRSHARELPWLQIELSRAEFVSLSEKREKLIEALTESCARIDLR